MYKSWNLEIFLENENKEEYYWTLQYWEETILETKTGEIDGVRGEP